ncbi:MAG TPA: SIMPL domain-containing protein [Candidatus Limnocylindrales bacterium]|nr:SIMPL domain-containing protein [Candidatus Limnocylindrales bacterium]
MRTRLSFLLCVTLTAAISYGQTAAPTATIQPNTIFAGADGKFEAPPDTAVMRLDISSQQDSSKAAYQKVSAAAEQVRQVIRSNGLDPKLAQLGFYAVQPVYDWKNPRHKVIAYRVVSSVTLKLRDFTRIGPLTEQFANIEETQNQSLSYTLEDVDQAKIKASEDALKKARSQAGAVAAAGGRALGELLYASVDVSQPAIIPMTMAPPMMARATMAEAAPPAAEFTPQTVTITAHVNAMFALK